MRNKLFVAAAMLPLLAACQTREAMPAVVAVSQTSLCQIDRPLTFSVAPTAGANDTGNRWDTDETIKELIAHNARLRAACLETAP